MKDIQDKYASYDQLVESFEVEVLLTHYLGSYQGDFYSVLRDGEKYGLLVFGYGSCSGCDELEAAYGSLEAIAALRDELWASVSWKSHDEMRQYVAEKDFALEWWGNSSEGKEFTDELKKLFS